VTIINKKESIKKESIKKLGYLGLLLGIYNSVAKKFKNIKKLILFEVICRIATILTAILTLFIAYKVFITGNRQFNETLKISESQIELAEQVRNETLKSGCPILAVNTSGFTPFIYKDNIQYEYLLKLKNFGDRPATEIEIKLYSILFERADSKFTIIDTFQEKSANSLANGATWDLGRKITTIKGNNEIIIYLHAVYKDLILKEEMELKSYYLIPRTENLKSNTEYRLMNLSYDDMIMIDKHIGEILK
jgi:hypothetical protein